jgi:hypothetical protein
MIAFALLDVREHWALIFYLESKSITMKSSSSSHIYMKLLCVGKEELALIHEG